MNFFFIHAWHNNVCIFSHKTVVKTTFTYNIIIPPWRISSLCLSYLETGHRVKQWWCASQCEGSMVNFLPCALLGVADDFVGLLNAVEEFSALLHVVWVLIWEKEKGERWEGDRIDSYSAQTGVVFQCHLPIGLPQVGVRYVAVHLQYLIVAPHSPATNTAHLVLSADAARNVQFWLRAKRVKKVRVQNTRACAVRINVCLGRSLLQG